MTASFSTRQPLIGKPFDARGSQDSWKVPEIMATIGPTLEKREDLRQAFEAGVRWIRLPCGYRQRPHVENARVARAASEDAGIPIQLLLDLPFSVRAPA